jgi:hypothetical protein
MKIEPALWVAALLLSSFAAWRAAGGPNPYAPGAFTGRVEDRRLYRFRDLSFSATERIAAALMDRAAHAPDAASRARMLAALAALQRERGMMNRAQAAEVEARRLAPDDLEVQRLLSRPLDLRALELEP